MELFSTESMMGQKQIACYDKIVIYRSIIDTSVTLAGRILELSVGLDHELVIEGISPVSRLFILDERHVQDNRDNDKTGPGHEEAGVQEVQLFVQNRELVIVLVLDHLVGSVVNMVSSDHEHLDQLLIIVLERHVVIISHIEPAALAELTTLRKRPPES